MPPRHYHLAVQWKQTNASTEQLINGYAVLDDTGVADPQDIVDTLAPFWQSNIRPYVTGIISIYGAELTPLDTTGTTVLSVLSGTLAGGLGGLAPSIQTCQLVTWQTANRGRKHRGRSYFPPANSANISDDGESWGNSQSANMQAAVASLLDDCETAGFPLGKMTDGDFEAYTAGVARQYMGTQRRRVNHR